MSELDYDSIIPDVREFIETENQGALLNIFADLHPADIEEILNRLRKEERRFIFDTLPHEIASEVLREMEAPVIEQVLEGASESRISALLDQMDSDDAADIIGELPEDIAEKVLDRMTEEDADEVKELLHYDEETAGGIMALEFVAMPATATVNETIEIIRESREELEDIYNIWVVDENNRLLGIVSLTDLVLAKGYTTLREIMNTEVYPVSVEMDQEEVANHFKKYDLISAPVIDSYNRLVGRITVDDIVDVMEEEGSEDLAFMAGAPDEEVLEESTFLLTRARIPWLLVAFFGNIITAMILQTFDATIQEFIASAFFFPLIMAMGGSIGQQASVIVVRGLATGDITVSDAGKRLIREMKISLLNGLFFSLLIFLIIYIWQSMLFASILALTMFIIINAAAVIGALLPLLFKRLNIDPALATAPFIATTNDIFGLLIYLVILTSFLGFFA